MTVSKIKTSIPNPLECLYMVPSTICNLQCVFCAYKKSKIKKQIMPFEDFKYYVEKATRFGFRTFNLTPLVGESLTDPTFVDKLNYLENHQGVFDFYFCTNFTLADEQFLHSLSRLKKLRCWSASIYGHDAHSFTDITRSDSYWYQKLIDQLQTLFHFKKLFAKTELRIRSLVSFDLQREQSELCQVIKQLKKMGVRVRIPTEYSNWSGLVKHQQLKSLKLQPKENKVSKTEPCVFLFFKHTVLPDGSINACSSGDGNAQYIIGNLKQNEFNDIYSPSNARYLELLHSQMNGPIDGICKDCTAYRGISETWHSYKYHKKKSVSLPQFFEWLKSHNSR